MPVYNESKTIDDIVVKVIKILKGVDFELIIVNDGSTDDSWDKITKLSKKYSRIKAVNLSHRGKSQTVKAGILKTKGEYVVIQDADMEYDPRDVIRMFKEIKKRKLDVIYGNRFGYKNKVIYIQNWIGNTFLSFFSGLFTGIRAGMFPRDMEVCYKMARGKIYRECAKSLVSKSNFGFEPEITAKFSKINNISFTQVPIKYTPRTVKEGKHMKAIKHGVLALFEIIYFNLIK